LPSCYEFVPSMMHLVERYLADLPADKRSDMDRRPLALDVIPGAKNVLRIAAKNQAGLPRELRRRGSDTTEALVVRLIARCAN